MTHTILLGVYNYGNIYYGGWLGKFANPPTTPDALLRLGNREKVLHNYFILILLVNGRNGHEG